MYYSMRAERSELLCVGVRVCVRVRTFAFMHTYLQTLDCSVVFRGNYRMRVSKVKTILFGILHGY